MKENQEFEEQLDENLSENEQEQTEATDQLDVEVVEELTTEQELEKKIDELTKALEEEEGKRLRVLADMENVKRRASLDYQTLQTYRAQNVMVNILPVLDNFERALAVEAKEEETKALLTGMEMVYRSLVEALKSDGLEEIEALDQEFDPNFHQAVMTGNEEEKDSGIVLEELQKGYKLKERVLRPSMVKVNE
ncbi:MULTISPECIES: nucleotide exchange factor GrpE [unclassified Sporosarcina]|uniref:nucleotide exchange factor GrpE n=1 Tax=unclassified Sporosarcina TaxID=2647733 RepID=UPI000C16452F|nr:MULTISPECIES: nucleotide exchange factor GrpE [unclassified Sporosarcina]PID00471.1 nucleotide exchange factor GrpE [Sporosarcina sp. P29]PID05760.1 nucleotide exchange factor GrpE [Sporosarcina sp. P30]PID08954.1 nucleotide exchange factor GrpE [Sporosarcina sp. P31]PID12040.1 nucleotide exchange factor GrpE [Sporosarcina sp. P32b]